MKRVALKSHVLAVLLLSCASAAHANDGGIALGGTPKLLTSHPSVRMESEVVRMDVYKKSLRVTCDFTFRNTGKTCTVRMGFPDQGVGAFNPDEESETDPMKTPPHTTFDSFRSYVNGREVSTKLIRADKAGQYWHTKTVTFPARQRVRIRDVYTMPVAGYSTRNATYANVGYILHTGSSWHGSIGHTTLIVTFHRKDKQKTLTARPAKGDMGRRDWKTEPPTHVYYQGVGKPTVSGNTLRFVRTDWRPTAKDDLTLYFKDWSV